MSAPGSQMSQRFSTNFLNKRKFVENNNPFNKPQTGGGMPGVEPPGGSVSGTMEFKGPVDDSKYRARMPGMFQGGQPPGGGQRMFQTMGGGSQTGGQFPQAQGPNTIQGSGQSHLAVMPSGGRPPAMGNDDVIGRGDIDPYLGPKGNVKYDPYTGKTIPLDERQNPINYAIEDLSRFGTDEARRFEFKDLPASPTAPGGTIDQLGNAAGNLISGGQQNIQAGIDQIGGATQNLLGTQGRIMQQSGSEAATRQAALSELQNLQRQALSPNLSPEQRQFYQQRADERRAEVQGLQGNLMDAFQRQQGSNAAQLAARGVLDSTTGSNTMAETQRRLGLDMNVLNQQAGELSRGEQLAGTEANRGAATQFGGLQSGQASSAGGILSNLMGQEAGIGSSLGQLGLGQGQLGSELSKIGISGLGEAGNLGLQGRGQEADLQQAAMLTRLMGNQTNLNNLQSYLNNKLNRRVTNAELQNLLNPPKPGFWSNLMGYIQGNAQIAAKAMV